MHECMHACMYLCMHSVGSTFFLHLCRPIKWNTVKSASVLDALLGLLDLSAAFDTADHDVLVERLARTYGLRSTALDHGSVLIYSIADNQFFTTEFHHRFVQGSVLGPLLFLL